MYAKTQFRIFSTALTALLAGALLLSACAPLAEVPTRPENSIPPATGEPIHIQIASTAIPTTTVQAAEVLATAIPTAQPLPNTETAATFGPLSLVVPPGVASGASGSEYPRNNGEDAAWWQKTPGHLEMMMGDYYALEGKFHQPQIKVYPAQAYAELVPTTFESIHRLDNILYGSRTPVSVDQLPAVPFFNSQQLFASNI